MTSELKLVVEHPTDGSEPVRADVSTLNPMDALNRRDIELIKKSLVGMHRDSAELRDTMVALHQRNNTTPTKSFFLALGLVGFVVIGALTAVRPQLVAALHQVPVLAHLSNNVTAR